LFFCNLSLPEKGKKQREENANEEAGNPGEIDRQIPLTKNNIPRQFSQPWNFGQEKKEHSEDDEG